MGEAKRKKQFSKETEEIPLSKAIFDICNQLCPGFNIPFDKFKGLVRAIVAAWNIANYPEEEKMSLVILFVKYTSPMSKALEADIAKIKKQGYQKTILKPHSFALELLVKLINCKNLLYPEDKRIITHVEVTETLDEGYRIEVASFHPDDKNVL